MLERVIEIIQEQLNLDGVEITEESSFKDDLGQILWTYSSLLWLLRRNMVWRFLPKIWSRSRQWVLLLNI